jgi:vacuolar-type H+-ATPase subunit F/Vma7
MTGLVEVVCRPATAPGFTLAGLPTLVVPEAADPGAAVVALLGRADVGVVLVEEAIYDAVPADLRRRLDRSPRPVVVPFPGPAWAGARTAEERIVELLRRAIGYRIKLQ